MDNYGTHRRRPCGRGYYCVHFTPTSASRLNLVERFFSQISEQWIKRSAQSVSASAGAIHPGILIVMGHKAWTPSWHPSPGRKVQAHYLMLPETPHWYPCLYTVPPYCVLPTTAAPQRRRWPAGHWPDDAQGRQRVLAAGSWQALARNTQTSLSPTCRAHPCARVCGHAHPLADGRDRFAR